jgi:ppGpp synthetase/RelA/SpoT-type nucleotidyltranferase
MYNICICNKEIIYSKRNISEMQTNSLNKWMKRNEHTLSSNIGYIVQDIAGIRCSSVQFKKRNLTFIN